MWRKNFIYCIIYANNNPMRFTDPTGYDGFDDVYLGTGMQTWNGINPEQDGPGGGSGGSGGGDITSTTHLLAEVNIKAFGPWWDNFWSNLYLSYNSKNWYRENNDPYLIWGSNAGNNVGGMFGALSVSGTRKYWQNMTMGGGGFGQVGGGITLSEASTIATAIGVVNELKMRLINWGLKSASGGENPIIKYLQFSKAMGKILGRFSAGVYFYNGVLDFQKGNNMSGIHNMINTSMSLLMTEGGALGLYSGGVYFLINETVGWPEMGRRQYQIIQKNPYWW